MSCVVILGIGELYLRWYFGWSIIGQQPEWNEFDDRRGWVLKPGEYSYVDVLAFRKVHVSINSLGIRNRPISLKVPEGIERISVLGDSFVFSAPLNEGERFTDRLQGLLGRNREVVSIGVPGYGTGQEILQLEDMIAKGYEAGSNILLVVFPNDLQDNLGLDYSTLQRIPAAPAFSVSSSGILQIDPAVRRQRGPSSRLGFFEQSLSYRLLVNSLVSIAIAYPWTIDVVEQFGGTKLVLPRTPGIIAGWYSEGWLERWRTTEAILGYAVRKMRERTSADILLVYIPSPFQTGQVFRRIVASSAANDARYLALLADGDRPQRKLHQFAESHRVRFVDLSAALRDEGIGGPSYFPREGHLTEVGSARVARELAEVLRRQETLSRQGRTATEQEVSK